MLICFHGSLTMSISKLSQIMFQLIDLLDVKSQVEDEDELEDTQVSQVKKIL